MGPACITFLLACAAGPEPSLKWSDPPGDDHGPGGYSYPSDVLTYPRGSFDLRAFEVEVDRNTVVFSVTLGAVIRRPPQVKRSNASEIPLHNNVYVQNIDIYIDRDPAPGAGFTESIPGRNVRFVPEHAWDTAVVITPQPFATRSMLSDWPPARRVLFADNISAIGPKLVARVDAGELGGFPKPDWGYQVLVTGATWEASFDLVRRYVNEAGLNAFTMLVQTLPERDAFGGGEVALIHPMVIDMLAPPVSPQEKLLGGYDAASKRLAVLPLVYPDPDAHAAARAAARPIEPPKVLEPPAPEWIELKVRDVQGDLVILERAGQPIEPYRIGTVVDSAGQSVCRVVVTAVHSAFVAATSVDCTSAIRPGAISRFEKSGSKE